jgi:hypothetical protein
MRMGFLDNLENSLKNLESRDESDGQRDRERREAESNAARAAAPYADLLRDSPFTAGLLEHATRLGFAKRMKVHIAWLGTTLRLEAREKKLELRPTPEGIVAVFIENGCEVRNKSVELDAKPENLAREWLGG